MAHNADYADLAVQYDQHLRATVREHSRARGVGLLPRTARFAQAVSHSWRTHQDPA